MLSKRSGAASAAVTLLVACSLPWRGDRRDEVNIIFEWRNNQIVVDARLDGHQGKFIVGSAQPRSVLDGDFGGSRSTRAHLVLGDRFATTVSPLVEDLGGIADGILGADAWRDSTLVVDYHRQLVILSREPAQPMNGHLYYFNGPPTLPITLDGRREIAVIDIALPDTLVVPTSLPAGGRRGRARIQFDQHDLGTVDIGVADTGAIRIGNRLLSKFLLQIDYRRGAVSLWRDPRIA